MTTSSIPIESRILLKKVVKNYVEDYKQERYLREEKLKKEVAISRNIRNILSEQNSVSLEDITNGFSIDPFSGEKVDMTKVSVPPNPKLAAGKPGAETPAEKGAPKVIPTDSKEVEKAKQNAVKAAKLIFPTNWSNLSEQCFNLYGMIGASAGSVLGWNLEYVIGGILKATWQLTTGPLMGAARFFKSFKGGAAAVADTSLDIAKTGGKESLKMLGRFGIFLKSAGKKVLFTAAVLGLMTVAYGVGNFMDYFSDDKENKIRLMKDYGNGNKSVSTDILQQLTDIPALKKTFSGGLSGYSIWDFARFPSNEDQQCFFAGVYAGIGARFTLRMLTLGVKELWKKIKKAITGASKKQTGSAKEALEQTNGTDLSKQISELSKEVEELRSARDAAEEALDKATKEAEQAANKIADETWITRNAIDMFQPKAVLLGVVKNQKVFTAELLEKLGTSKFSMGVWADDPRKGFRIVLDLAEDANIDQKTYDAIQEALDQACLSRTKDIHNSLRAGASDLLTDSTYTSTGAVVRAGAKMADGVDVTKAMRHEQVINALKGEANALEIAIDELSAQIPALKTNIENILSEVGPDQAKALQEAFDKAAQESKLGLDEFSQLVRESSEISQEIIEKFHSNQTKLAANAEGIKQILKERVEKSNTIFEFLSFNQGDNFAEHFGKLKGPLGDDKVVFEGATRTADQIGTKTVAAIGDTTGSKVMSGLKDEIDEMAQAYKSTFFEKGGRATPKPKGVKDLGNNIAQGAAKTATKGSESVFNLRQRQMGRIWANFKDGRGTIDQAMAAVKKNVLIPTGTAKRKGFKVPRIPDSLLAADGPIATAMKDATSKDDFITQVRQIIQDQGLERVLETNKEKQIMSESDIKNLVKQLFKENSGKGYSQYPYNSSVRDEEEPKQDYMEEWKALSVDLIRDESRTTAIEIAKVLVKDLELFEDVLDLAGQNQSVGTEILTKLKQLRDKA